MNGSPLKHENQVSLQDYAEMGWRRKWWLIVPVLVSVLVAVVLLYKLPKSYRSSTLILVEGQKVPEEYVKSAVGGTMEDRLANIRQQILSRSLLQKIVDDLGLYTQEIKNGSTEEVLDLMRRNIDIKTDGARRAVDAFTISFEGSDPRMVMNVTNKLASLYIEENLKAREQLVEGTTDFLEKELQTLKQSLDKQEQLVSEHKRRYMGSLPQQLDTNLRSLDRYQMELQTISTSLVLAEDKKNTLEERMAALSLSAGTDESKKPGMAEEQGNTEFANLAQMKKTLDALRMEYTEAYPDIIILKRRIKDLEESLSRKQRANKERGDDKSVRKPQEPMTGEIFNNFESQKQFEELTAEIKSLKERRQIVSQNIRQLEKSVEQTPIREQEMDVLLRDYENTKKAYQSLLDKKLNAELSENLEKRQKGEQFRIVDSANFPQKPYKPDRLRVIGLCLGAGFAMGLGLILLVENVDRSFKKPEEIENEYGIPVLAAIPKFKKKGMKRREPISDGRDFSKEKINR